MYGRSLDSIFGYFTLIAVKCILCASHICTNRSHCFSHFTPPPLLCTPLSAPTPLLNKILQFCPKHSLLDGGNREANKFAISRFFCSMVNSGFGSARRNFPEKRAFLKTAPGSRG